MIGITATIMQISNCQQKLEEMAINKNSSLVMLIEMITPGDKVPLNSEEYPLGSFKDFLSISEIGKRKQLLLGKHVQNQYPIFFKNLKRKGIKVESLDANWTIKSVNSHIVGVYNIFDGTDIGFEPDDPQVLPPEKLSFDPNEIIDFKTALPYGIRFLPVFCSSGEDSLNLMMAHDYCENFREAGKVEIEKSNNRLGKSDFFKNKLLEIENELGFKSPVLKETKYLERCVSLLYYYNKILDEKNEDFINKEKIEFLKTCENAYFMSIHENKRVSRVQVGLNHVEILRRILDRIFHLTGENQEKFKTISKEVDIDFGILSTEDIKKERNKKKTENIKFLLISGETNQILSELILRNRMENARNCGIKKLKNLHNGECEEIPPAASNFIYELYQGEDFQFKIRILYNNRVIECSKNPKVEYCSLKDFSDFLKSITEKDLKGKCGGHLLHRYPELEDKGEVRTIVHIIISGALFFISLIFFVIGCTFRKKLKGLESSIERELGEREQKEK